MWMMSFSVAILIPDQKLVHEHCGWFWILITVVLEEEEALLSEMDVTGQAFEDMQEQNSRLLQQLREKDDANFKLMSERIKSNQIYKLLKEEKEELAEQVLTFKTQVGHHVQTETLSPLGRGPEVLLLPSLSRWTPSCWLFRSLKKKRESCRARWPLWKKNWLSEHKHWNSTRGRWEQTYHRSRRQLRYVRADCCQMELNKNTKQHQGIKKSGPHHQLDVTVFNMLVFRCSSSDISDLSSYLYKSAH